MPRRCASSTWPLTPPETPSWLEITMATSTYLTSVETGSAWCRRRARPAPLWLSAFAGPPSSSWLWLTTPSSALTKTQSSWSVGCGVTRGQCRPSRSRARVATPSPRRWTRLSCGTWTPSRGRGSSTSDSLLAFSGCFSCLSVTPSSAVSATTSSLLGRATRWSANTSSQSPTVTRDGKSLAAGGRSNLLHLWCLDSQQLVRVIQMPTQVRTVRQLEFLPDSFDGGASKTLGVLSQDGVMRFVDIHTCKLLFRMGSHEDAITAVTVSPNGRHVVAVMDNGSVNIYRVLSLTQELNKPPPSRVAVVSGGGAVHSSHLNVKVRSEVVLRQTKSSGRRTHGKILRPPAVSAAEDKENELPAGLNKKRLVAMLKEFGEYPAKYRMFVWRSWLRLPENHAAYSSLTDKGLHPAYLAMHDKYHIKSHKVLSALAHWAAIFGEVEYLPLVAFPFVKLFQNNPMLCFEVVASVLVNWGQHWFEYFPNPPLNILGMAENVLAHHDKELLQHLVDCGVTSQLYVWPLLETLFSEVLTRDEWLRLFDNIFSNHPAFLLMACVAYITCCREPLLRCSQKQDFEYFFHHRNNLDLGAMIKEAYRLMGGTPADIHPRNMLSDLTPLTEGQYPVFNHYPEFIVEYQSREREKIRLQEKEYLRERQEVSTLRTDFVRRQAEEEAYFAQQELLQNAEEQRRNILAQEEEKLTEQRAKLTATKRELKVKELQLLDATKRRFLKHQQDLRASQVQRLDQEISRKMDLRERETAAAVQDLEVRQMELEAQRRLLEQNMFKVQERTGQEVEEETEMRMRRAEKEDESYTEMLHGTEENMQALEESLAEACQLDLDSRWQREVAQRLQQVDAERDRKREKLKELHRHTAAEEERLADTMRDVAGRKWDDVMRSRAQLQEQRQAASVPDGQRPVCSTTGLLHGPAAAHVRTRSAPAKQPGTDMVCLNSSSPSESTSTNSILNVCNKGERDASHKTTNSTHQHPRDSLSAKHRSCQQPIWVQSMSTIQGRSSSACSVSLQAKSDRQLNVGR